MPKKMTVNLPDDLHAALMNASKDKPGKIQGALVAGAVLWIQRETLQPAHTDNASVGIRAERTIASISTNLHTRDLLAIAQKIKSLAADAEEILMQGEPEIDHTGSVHNVGSQADPDVAEAMRLLREAEEIAGGGGPDGGAVQKAGGRPKRKAG